MRHCVALQLQPHRDGCQELGPPALRHGSTLLLLLLRQLLVGSITIAAAAALGAAAAAAAAPLRAGHAEVLDARRRVEQLHRLTQLPLCCVLLIPADRRQPELQ